MILCHKVALDREYIEERVQSIQQTSRMFHAPIPKNIELHMGEHVPTIDDLDTVAYLLDKEFKVLAVHTATWEGQSFQVSDLLYPEGLSRLITQIKFCERISSMCNSADFINLIIHSGNIQFARCPDIVQELLKSLCNAPHVRILIENIPMCTYRGGYTCGASYAFENVNNCVGLRTAFKALEPADSSLPKQVGTCMDIAHAGIFANESFLLGHFKEPSTHFEEIMRSMTDTCEWVHLADWYGLGRLLTEHGCSFDSRDDLSMQHIHMFLNLYYKLGWSAPICLEVIESTYPSSSAMIQTYSILQNVLHNGIRQGVFL